MRPARAPRGWRSGRSVRGPQCLRAALGPKKNWRFDSPTSQRLRDFELVISRAYTRDLQEILAPSKIREMPICPLSSEPARSDMTG